jgi:hypothetical protein
MEPFWSLAGATGGNRLQMRRHQERLRYAKTVAAGCDRFRTEGVDICDRGARVY